MQNPFEDLIPKDAQKQSSPQQRENPFADLIPQKKDSDRPKEDGFLKKTFSPQLHALAAVGNAAKNTASSLYDFGKGAVSSAPGTSEFIDYAMSKVPKGYRDKVNNFDAYKSLGLEKNFADDIAQTGLEFAPYMSGAKAATTAGKLASKGVPKIANFISKNPKTAKYLEMSAENALSSGAYGAAKAENGEGIRSGLIDAGIGAFIPGVQGALIDPVLRYGAKKYAQSAIPEFTKKATEKLKETLPLSKYAEMFSDKYLNSANKNKANWSKLDKTAADLDQKTTGMVRQNGKLVDASQKGLKKSEIENVDRMGKPIGSTMIGKDSSNIPSQVGKEIIGYDAGGAPIIKEIPHDFSAVEKQSPLTRSFNENYGRKTKAMSGEYDASGSPIYKSGRNFDNSAYSDYISRYQNKINSMEPSMRAPYEQAMKLSEVAKSMAPESFSGSVSARKNINQSMKDFLSEGGKAINPENRESKQFLRGLKENLKNENLTANEQKVGKAAIDNFKNDWEAANKSHQEVQEFMKSYQDSTGTVKPTRQMRERLQEIAKNNPTDPNFIGKFMPNLTEKGSKGIKGFEHLENLLGDKKLAQDAAKSFLFQKQIGSGSNTVDAAARYDKLSATQKKWLFGSSDEGKMLEAINKTRLAFGREPEKTLAKVGHGIMGWGVPGLIGYGASRASGEDEGKSLVHALEAMGVAKGGKYLASKSANVPRVERAINFAQSGVPNTSRYLNALYNLKNGNQGN